MQWIRLIPAYHLVATEGRRVLTKAPGGARGEALAVQSGKARKSSRSTQVCTRGPGAEGGTRTHKGGCPPLFESGVFASFTTSAGGTAGGAPQPYRWELYGVHGIADHPGPGAVRRPSPVRACLSRWRSPRPGGRPRL